MMSLLRRHKDGEPGSKATAATVPVPLLVRLIGGQRIPSALRLAAACGFVAAAAIGNRLLIHVFGPFTPFFFYFPAVIGASLFCGFYPGLLATGLSLLATLYCDIAPIYSFKAPEAEDAIRLGAFAVIAIVICALNRHIRKAAEAFGETESRFRLLVTQIKDYAIFMLDPEGRVATWNEGARALKGYDADEIIGQHFSRFYPKEDQAKPARELETAARMGRFEEEGWRVRKDGSRFWASVVITAIRDKDGALVGFAKVERDLTERRTRDQAIVAKDQLLLRRSKDLAKAYTDLEEFSHSAWHDLRAPLRTAQGYAYLVRKRAGAAMDADTRALLDRIIESANHMDLLIKDLLTYAKTARGEFEPAAIDLDRIIPRIVDDYALREKADVRIRTPLGRVIGRESLMVQMISNLLDNASKFVPPQRKPAIEISADRTGGKIRLAVQDNGIGIPQEHCARLFKPFERLEAASAYEGTGMGLAIVRKAVERMGGHCGVESKINQGSRFWVELPESR